MSTVGGRLVWSTLLGKLFSGRNFSHLCRECIRRRLAADADASKADTESESGGGIFTTRVQSPQSHKYPSTLPLSTPAPNEPELTALMQLVVRRKLQLCNRDALNSGL